MTGKPLRVCLAGAGMISWYHLTAWTRLAGVSVTAICDPSPEKARDRAREFDVPRVYSDVAEMLEAERPDAVDIASPVETHADLVRLAADRGIAVLCQKPLTPTLAQARSLSASVEGRTRLMVHENWRFRPYYRQLAAWMGEGLIGQPILCRMSMRSAGLVPAADGRRPALERQPFMASMPRLLVFEALIHHLDVVRWLLGPLQVTAARLSRNSEAVRGEDSATIMLDGSDGLAVVVDGTMHAPGYGPRPSDHLELVGRAGTALLDGTVLVLKGRQERRIEYDADAAYQASFDGAIAHFVTSLRDGSEFETCPSDNLATLTLIEDVYVKANWPS